MAKLKKFYRIYEKKIENVCVEYLYDGSIETKKIDILEKINDYDITDQEYDSIEEAEKSLTEYLDKLVQCNYYVKDEYVIIKCYKII